MSITVHCFAQVCQDAHSTVVAYSSVSDFISNTFLLFLLVSPTVVKLNALAKGSASLAQDEKIGQQLSSKTRNLFCISITSFCINTSLEV